MNPLFVLYTDELIKIRLNKWETNQVENNPVKNCEIQEDSLQN